MEQTYGERLKAIREARGLTVEELAERAGLDESYVWSVEESALELGMGHTARLADALGVEPEVLAGLAPLAAVAQERAAASPANARSLHQKAMNVLEKQLALLEKDNLLNSETEAACRIIDSMISVLYCMPDEGGVSDG